MMGWLPIVLFIIIGAFVLIMFRLPHGALHPVGFAALSWWMGMITVMIQ